jgi:pSer/pThr/pTyr-binding forkhead associated (FHA) protein
MIQLKILSGKKAGSEIVACHFPFWVGRAADCQLSLDDPGVWEKHFQIRLNPENGFVLVADPKTSVVIDDKPVQEAALRNGDIIQIGLAKIQFSISPTTQKSLALREALTWVGFAAVFFAEVALIYQLLN